MLGFPGISSNLAPPAPRQGEVPEKLSGRRYAERLALTLTRLGAEQESNRNV
jgi:hypothetical protein